MDEEAFDVIVIGGGSTGTAVARDCAMRGLRTVLVERDDIASATVGTCAGMISSGFKYYNEPAIMDMCSSEVVHFRNIARHIVAKLPIIFPLLDIAELSSGSGKGMDEYSKRVEQRGVPPFLLLTPEASLEIEPTLNPDLMAGGYIEEYFIDPFRLCILQALSARKHGAHIRTYCEVVAIHTSDGHVEGVSIQNRLTDRVEQLKGKVVVNATGPWAGKIAGLAGVKVELRLNKGAHIILDRRVVNVGVTTRSVDKRWVYMYPHENTTLIGTTALDTWEDPDRLVTTADEIEYLLKSFEWVVPSIRQARIIRTMEGVRPMAPIWKVPEDDVTRGYEIIDHANEGVEGFLTFIGGKLVMCRHMAEAITDIACRKLGFGAECRTHLEPLPGMEGDIDVIALAAEYNVSQHALERMRVRRGTGVLDVLALLEEHPEWRTAICTCEPVIEAELRYVIREEFPHTLNDLRRRVRIGTGPCQSTFCVHKAAAIFAEESELDGSELKVEILDFLAERWKGKRQSFRGVQVDQEELTQGIYACVANLDKSDLDYDPKPWEEFT